MIKKLLLPLIAVTALFASGCRIFTDKVTLDEKGHIIGREISYGTLFLNSETEGLEARTPQGELKIAKNASDSNRFLDTVDSLAAKIPSPAGQTVKTTVVQPPTQVQPNSTRIVPVAPRK